MPTNNVTSTHHLDSDANLFFTKDGFQRLRTYLGRVSKGQPRVYTAPFAKGQRMNTVMNDWFKILVSIEDKWPSLMQFEKDLANKVGPLSVMKPLDQRLTDVYSYYDDILLSSTTINPAAIKAVISEFAGISGLRPRDLSKTVEIMKKSTNSGNPFFTKRRNVQWDTLPCSSFCNSQDYTFTKLKDKIWNAAAVIGWRGQEGGMSVDDVKQRVVWMFPFSVNVNELQVYQPLIEGCQSLNLVPAWVSMESVDKEVTKLFDTKSNDDLVVCTDFSKFDQHFNDDLQDAAESILSSLLTRSTPSRTWLFEVFPLKYIIPLIIKTYDNRIIMTVGQHGMASGSGGTNVDETLVHRALQYEVAMRAGERLNPHSMCLGDDGILTYPGITVDDVVEAYQTHGQVCNKDKQYASSQDCVYLRRWHHQEYRMDDTCVGVYSTCRALGRLRYLERFMDPQYWSPEMVALRQLSIIENCKYHPLRNEFAEFCMERDKYKLGILIPGFLDNIVQYAKESIDHMPDFLGYTKTLQGFKPEGISEWWIVNYLKSHR